MSTPRSDQMKLTILRHIVRSLLAPIVLTASVTFAQNYTVIDIGALVGGNSVPAKINLSGQSVGQSGKMYGVQTHAFFFANGKLQDLGTLSGGDFSTAFDVNTRGAVVGDSNTATNMRAFLWDSSTGMQDLGTLPGDTGSRAYGINDADQVVGYSSGPGGITAFSWKNKSGMQSLGWLLGGDMSEAYDINGGGIIVGFASTRDGERHAVLWKIGSSIQDLGTLPAYPMSEAHRIDNAGDVIGSASGLGESRAVLWPSGGGIQNLGTLGGDFSTALDLNNSGEIVGSSTGPLGARAFSWTSSTGMIDLNTQIPSNSAIVLTAAIGINNAGMILAVGAATTDKSPFEMDDTHHHAGQAHAFILIPLPKS
jgi:probable HAF family extracellular repeat protein